ncbi:hypothetical protein [Kitasatospora aureofaciens]|uniref:hypothetical protein n=1 Tax=Kitasatospora aureofaciens TaxID=1894 RepID=UPI0033CAD676
MPIGQDRLIPQYLIKWEQTPEDEKAAVLTRQAQEQAGQWEKTRQRKRRAAAFAASAGLPDPLHYLDDVTDAHGALIGRAV